MRLQRLFGDAVAAGIVPIEPEAGGDGLALGALDGSEHHGERRRRRIEIFSGEPVVGDAVGTPEPSSTGGTVANCPSSEHLAQIAA